MIVCIHQPAYLPWLGYLQRIAASDVFVLLDNVQYEKNSFVNRNRIKSATGPLWLTVPLHARSHFEGTILDTQIDNGQPWRSKHLRAIEFSYRRAGKFAGNFERLVDLFSQGTAVTSIAELCLGQLQFWLREFAIETRIVRASHLPVAGKKSELVASICEHLGADAYLSGPQGRNYLDLEMFSGAGIEVRFHDFVGAEYAQLFGPFVPGLSVVDYWMNCGGGSIKGGI